MSPAKFHHGNLRAALIELVMGELAQGVPISALSLRDLAQRLGVSSSAPYRHFDGKDALLRAVAEEGHERLLQVNLAAAQANVPARERLRRACEAYLDLALGNAGLFDLIFFSNLYQGRQGRDPHGEGSAFATFEGLVAGAWRISDAREARKEALAIWSLLHGFVTLHARGSISAMVPLDELRARVVSMACDGERTG